MPVNCLTPEEKVVVVALYKEKRLNQKQIAQCANTSQRTVHRVIEEAGLATPVARIQGEAYTVMQLLKEHGVDLPKLKQMLAVRKLLYTSSVLDTHDLTVLDAA